MCYIQQGLKPHPLMGYTERSHWWGAFAAWRWGFRCEGFCQHPGDFHTCSGACRKNKFSLATPYAFVFPIICLLGNGLRPPAPAGCWEGKGDFESPQILVQGQNPAQANPCWCCGPSEQQGRGEVPWAQGHPQPATLLPARHGLFSSCSHLWVLAVISKHLLQIIQDYRN